MNLKVYISLLKARKAFILLCFLMMTLEATAQEQETGTVIFFRKLRTSGLLEGYKMYYNDSIYVGNIKNGRYLVFQCPIGTARFAEKPGAKQQRTLEVEAGKTYYIECYLTVTPAIIGSGFSRMKFFGEVDNEKGERIVKKLKESKPADEGETDD